MRPVPTWRERLRPAIAEVLAANRGIPLRLLRRRLRAAFPYAERRGWPYKVWLDEIRVQRGLRVFRGRKHRAAVGQKVLL